MAKNSHNNLMREKILSTGLTLISALETDFLSFKLYLFLSVKQT